MMTAKNLCLWTLLTTFILLLWGGLVHNTNSGLACPDWPLCYGQLIPPFQKNIWIEHGHRFLASLVGLLTIGLVVCTRKKRHLSEIKLECYRLSKIALLFVVVQGLLGAITVLYRLPTSVSTSHLALAMVFFATLILLYHRLGEEDLSMTDLLLKERLHPGLRIGFLITTFLLYIQIVLGAFLRHSGGGGVCGFGIESSLLCRNIITWGHSWWPTGGAAKLHMLHRYFGVFVAGFVLFQVLKLFLALKEKIRPLGVYCAALSLGIVAQVFLGVLMIITGLQVLPTTAHLGMASFCLGLSWFIYLRLVGWEKCLFKTVRSNKLTDTIELMRPKLSFFVVGTVWVGVLSVSGPLNFFQCLFTLVLIGLTAMGATTLNSYIERESDKLMSRTATRPLPSNRMSPRWALIQGMILLGIPLPLLAINANVLTAVLALVGALLYLFAYTPLKREGPYALYVGAVSGALPPLLGRVSVIGQIDTTSWVLFAILSIWQLPHFLAISIYHAEDYQNAKIKVYPNILNIQKTRLLVALFTLLLIGCSLLPFYFMNISILYRNTALALGMILLCLAGKGFFLKTKEQHIVWGKEYFWGSIIYLPLLLGSMVFLT